MKRLLSLLLLVALCCAVLPASALAASKKTVYISSTGSGSLNLRKGPGKDYGVAGYVFHGDKVTPGKTSGEWTKVTVSGSGATGWIKTKYIDGTTKSLGTGTWKVTSSKAVTMRGGPGTSYSSKGTVQPGASVKVLNTEDDWIRVTVTSSGKTGWIKASAIGKGSGSSQPSTPSTPSTPSEPAVQEVRHVSASTLNVRSGAGAGYGQVTKLVRGDALRVLGNSGGWLKIRTFDGVSGWVSGNYTAAGATATVTASTLNVRKSASASSQKVASLLRDDEVEVISVTSSGWAYVHADFITGYVSVNYLRF